MPEIAQGLNQAPGDVMIGGTGAPPPANAPDMNGMDSAKIADMLAALNQKPVSPSADVDKNIPPAPPAPGSPMDKQGQPQEPQQPPEGQQKAEQELQIPDKFKNPDGTINQGFFKSYEDMEKAYGRLQNANYENQSLKQQVNMLNQMIDSMKQDFVNKPVQTQTGQRQYTPEEIKLMEENPGEFINREIDRRLNERDKTNREEMIRNQEADYKLLTAVNQARVNLPGFQYLEPTITELLKQNWVGRSPESIQTMYNAAIGMKIDEIVNSVRNKSFQEGIEHQKKLLASHVEGGGKDTTPANTGELDLSNIGKYSSEDLARVLPRANDSSTRVEY